MTKMKKKSIPIEMPLTFHRLVSRFVENAGANQLNKQRNVDCNIQRQS